MLSLGRAEAVLRSRASGRHSRPQPHTELAFAVIRSALKSVQMLEPVVTRDRKPLEDVRDLLSEVIAQGEGGLEGTVRCGELADELKSLVPAVKCTVLDLFEQAWETALPAKAAERAVAEVASLAVWRGRDYECLLADVQRFLQQIPAGKALLSVLCPMQRRIRVAAVVEGSRTLAHLDELFDAGADIRQFPIGKREPDGWGQGTSRLKEFASLHGHHRNRDARAEERSAAAVLLTLRVTAPDRGTAVHVARRGIEEALDAYMAGNRIAELRLRPEILVYEETGNRSRQYTLRGPAINTARPLTSHWPAEIRECLRTAHIARSTSSPLTRAALSWAALEAAGIKHGYKDNAPHVRLARALSLQALRQQLISSHQCVRTVATATCRAVKRRAEDASRAVRRMEQHLGDESAPLTLEQQLMQVRERATLAHQKAADADNLYLRPLSEIDLAATVNEHGLLCDPNRWADILAASPEASEEIKAGSEALVCLHSVLPGLPAHELAVWRARLTNPRKCAEWLTETEERYRAQLSWMYVVRNTALHQGVFTSVADSHDAHGASGTVDLMLEVLGNWYSVANAAALPESTWSAPEVIISLAQRQQNLIQRLKAGMADLNFTHLTSPTSNGHDRQ